LRQHLGAGPETADVEALRLEVTELKQKLEQLTEENNELKAKVLVCRCSLSSSIPESWFSTTGSILSLEVLC
jgi:regulator of replication initiation timing